MGEPVSRNLRQNSSLWLSGFLIFILSLVGAGAAVFLSYLSYRWYIEGYNSESSRMILSGLSLALVFSGLLFVIGIGVVKLARKRAGRVWTAAGIIVSLAAAGAMVLLACLGMA